MGTREFESKVVNNNVLGDAVNDIVLFADFDGRKSFAGIALCRVDIKLSVRSVSIELEFGVKVGKP